MRRRLEIKLVPFPCQVSAYLQERKELLSRLERDVPTELQRSRQLQRENSQVGHWMHGTPKSLSSHSHLCTPFVVCVHTCTCTYMYECLGVSALERALKDCCVVVLSTIVEKPHAKAGCTFLCPGPEQIGFVIQKMFPLPGHKIRPIHM